MMFKRHLVEVGKIWLKYQHVFEELDNEIKEEVKVADLTIEERTEMMIFSVAGCHASPTNNVAVPPPTASSTTNQTMNFQSPKPTRNGARN